jgi:RNA polymerase sigma factor (sigma-70 family)
MIGRRRQKSPLLWARDHPEDFDVVFVRYHERVLRFMVRATFDPEVAFDLMAETFTLMLANLHAFEGETERAGEAWMWAIARNGLNRWFRQADTARRYREFLIGDVRSPGTEELERIEELADMEPLRARVGQALSSLDDASRDLLQWRVVEQWSYDEIAEALDITPRAALHRVARALAKLADRFHALENGGAAVERAHGEIGDASDRC